MSDDVLVEAKEWKIFATENHDGGSTLGKPVCSPYVDGIVEFCDLVTSEITRLRSRVEELERERITDEQIDKAWANRRSPAYRNGYEDKLLWASDLGIVACEECGGSGYLGCDPIQVIWETCLNCHGLGWRRNDE